MKLQKILLALPLAGVLLFSSCGKTKGKVTVTYTKATAVYGDIDAVRSTPLIGQNQDIVDPGKIFIGEDFILIGEETKGIHVFNNTNAASPTYSSFINLPFTREFFVKGDVIYAESQYDMLKVNISDLSNPVLIDRLENAFSEPMVNDNGQVLLGFNYEIKTEQFKVGSREARALEEDSYLYYDYQNELIPVSNVPSSFAGSSDETKGTLNKIALAQSHVYVLGRDKVHVFGDQGSLTDLGSTYAGWEMETIYAEGDHLYIGTMSSMIIMGLGNPENPNVLGEYWHPTSCDPVLPAGDVAYLTLRTADFSGCGGDENTLQVIDINDPTNPTPLNVIPMTSPYGMAIVDNVLYVGEGENGVTLFDVTNRQAPIYVSTQTGESVYDILEHPTLPNQILTTGEHGLNQYEWDATNQTLNFLSSIDY